MLKQCAVIGQPIHHSLSPAIHQAAYAELGLDWDYSAIEVSPEGLPSFIADLGESWVGLSVTMPHKQALLDLGDPDELTRLVGAGNTYLVGSKLVTNTDVAGFVHAIGQEPVTARIIGGGGTARAAIVALSKLGCRYLNLVLRNPAKAAELDELATELGMEVAVDPLGVPLSPAEVTISALPGLAADDWLDSILADTDFLLDVAYDPWPTALHRAAEESGIGFASGIDLLVGQAVEQVRLMTGLEVSVELLTAAALAELERRR